MFISKIRYLLENHRKPSYEEKNLILLAMLISFAIMLKGTVSLMGFIPMESNASFPITIKNWLYSFFIISVYSWFLLDFNLRRKSKLFPKISKLGSFTILSVGNLFIFISTLTIQLIGESIIDSTPISDEELYITTFGWFIVFISSLLIVQILKLRQKVNTTILIKKF